MKTISGGLIVPGTGNLRRANQLENSYDWTASANAVPYLAWAVPVPFISTKLPMNSNNISFHGNNNMGVNHCNGKKFKIKEC